MEDSIQKRIDFYLKYIANHQSFTECNSEKLDIYEGNLMPYVMEILKNTLSDNYYQKIKDRVLPINVLTRIIDKLSKVYINEPSRTDEKYQEFIEEMEQELEVNLAMSMADEYSNLFKGYAIEPFFDGKPGLRVIPYDRFIVIGRDKKNPLKVTDFIKFMGEYEGVCHYHAYTATEFIPFNSKGEILREDLEGNDGINPIGRIPFVYGNRSRQSIVPTQDTDITQLTKMIPVILTDLSGAIMFQCFSIIYGIDINFENIVMSPNAVWSFKSDPGGEKPQIGTIKPEADVDKVLTFIKSTFAFWLETKGVRIGSLNTMDAQSVGSGISKIIDEMDVYEIKKKQITFFKNEEQDLWDLLKVMNNHWVKAEPDYEGKIIGDDFDPTIVFDEPRPEISRREQVEVEIMEIDAKLKPRFVAMQELNPDLSETELEEWEDMIAEQDKKSQGNGIDNKDASIDMGKGNIQDPEAVQAEGTASDSSGNS